MTEKPVDLDENPLPHQNNIHEIRMPLRKSIRILNPSIVGDDVIDLYQHIFKSVGLQTKIVI